jgi:hypothetical protein
MRDLLEAKQELWRIREMADEIEKLQMQLMMKEIMANAYYMGQMVGQRAIMEQAILREQLGR